jgi:1-acyl-sn-glycerol-3-phosphate acyltransferase
VERIERRWDAGIWMRRIIGVAFILPIAVLNLALLPVTLVLSLLADAVRRRGLATTRVALQICFFIEVEAFGVLMAGAAWVASGFGLARQRYETWNYWFQQWWGWIQFSSARRLFRLTVTTEGEEALTRAPAIFFIRHTSVADTLMPAALISHPHGIRLRYVLKRELLWDPCMSVVGPRIPNCFVKRGRGGESARVALLAKGMGERDGVLIYPEGMVLTPAKARKLAERNGGRAPRPSDEGFIAVHPPRRGGPLAILENAPGIDVVFVAHVGFEVAPGVRQILRGDLIGAHFHMAFWRVDGQTIPNDADGRSAWLTERWREMDRWVVEHQRTPETRTRGGRKSSR